MWVNKDMCIYITVTFTWVTWVTWVILLIITLRINSISFFPNPKDDWLETTGSSGGTFFTFYIDSSFSLLINQS